MVKQRSDLRNARQDKRANQVTIFDQDEYSYQKFEGEQITSDMLHRKCFIGCEFIRCRFDEVDCTQVTFEDCLFRDTGFYSVLLNGTSLIEAEFDGCKFVSINFSLVNQMILSFGFQSSKLIACTFDSMNIIKTKFSDCSFDDTIFQECQLRQSNFENGEFSNTHFRHCNLEKARFVGTEGLALDPLQNKIEKAVFDTRSAMALLDAFDITLI